MVTKPYFWIYRKSTPQSLQKNQAIFLQGLPFGVQNDVFDPLFGILAQKSDISYARKFLSLSSDSPRSFRSAGHRSWQKRQPAPQSKLRELRQRARSACFVPVIRKTQNNRNFTLSQKMSPCALSLQIIEPLWMICIRFWNLWNGIKNGIDK